MRSPKDTWAILYDVYVNISIQFAGGTEQMGFGLGWNSLTIVTIKNQKKKCWGSNENYAKILVQFSLYLPLYSCLWS